MVKHVAFALNKEVKNANPILHIVLLGEKSLNWLKYWAMFTRFNKPACKKSAGMVSLVLLYRKGKKSYYKVSQRSISCYSTYIHY